MLRSRRALPLLALLCLLVACGQGGATAVISGQLVGQPSAIPSSAVSSAAGGASGAPTRSATGVAPAGSAVVGGGATAVAAPSGKAIALALIANFDDDTIGVYSVAANGVQSSIPGHTFRTGPRPSGLVLSPDGRFAYVSAQGREGAAGGIWVYALDASGLLTPVAGSPFKAGETPGPLAFDPAGKRLYVESGGEGEGIYAFTLDAASGALSPVAGSPFEQQGDRAAALAFSPNGRFLYLAQDDGRGINAYTVDPASGKTTALKLADAIETTNAFALAINPAGTLLYAGFEAGIFGYRIEGDGTLTALSGRPLVKGTHKALLFHPNGRILYAANYFEYTLTAYTVDGSGQLAANAGALTTAAYPTALALDRGAAFLYATTEDNLLDGSKVGGDGAALTALPGDPPATGAHPAAIALTNGLPAAP